MERHPGNLLPAGAGTLLPADCPADQLEQGRATAQQHPNYPKRTILDLFSFMDWVMVLPGKLDVATAATGGMRNPSMDVSLTTSANCVMLQA